MRDHVEPSTWPWARSLALAESHTPLQVDRILFDSVRDRCTRMGVEEGSVVTCRDRDGDSLEVELPNGSTARIPRQHAWFILVEGAAS